MWVHRPGVCSRADFRLIDHPQGATLKLQQGVYPKVAQELLHHADITVTLNAYLYVLPGMQGESAYCNHQIVTYTGMDFAFADVSRTPTSSEIEAKVQESIADIFAHMRPPYFRISRNIPDGG